MKKLPDHLEEQIPRYLQIFRKWYFSLPEQEMKEIETKLDENKRRTKEALKQYDKNKKIESQNNKEKKFCFECGYKINRTAKYCEDCGAKQPKI